MKVFYKDWFVGAGKDYESSLVVFKEFVQEIREMEGEIPSLKFAEQPDESHIDFRFRGGFYRFRLKGEIDDNQRPTVRVVLSFKADHDEEFKEVRSLGLARCAVTTGSGLIGQRLELSQDGRRRVSAEEAFCFLMMGE